MTLYVFSRFRRAHHMLTSQIDASFTLPSTISYIFPFTCKTKDNYSIAGTYYAVKQQPRGTLIAIHGLLMHQYSLFRLHALFPEYNLVCIDLRATGKSEGWFTTLGIKENEDVAAAYEWVKNYEKEHAERNPYHYYCCYGVSMGARALIEAGAKGSLNGIDMLYLDSLPVDIRMNMNEFIKNYFSCGKKFVRSLIHFIFERCTAFVIRFVAGISREDFQVHHSLVQLKIPFHCIVSVSDTVTSPLTLITALKKAGYAPSRSLSLLPPAPHALLTKHRGTEIRNTIKHVSVLKKL